MRRLGALVLMVAPLAAQQAHFSAPVLGYLYDPGARAIRVVSGVPGAAGLDKILIPNLDCAFVSSRNYAIADGSDGLRVLRWSGEHVTDSQSLSEGSCPDEVVFSPSAFSAAVYYQGTGVLEVWAGLPDPPRLAFRTTSKPAAFAVSDDASVVLAAGENLVLLTSRAERILRTGEHRSVAFLESRTDAVASDERQTLLIRNVDREAQATVIADATGLLTVSGSTVVISTEDALVFVEPETGRLSSVNCNCGSRSFEHLSGTSYRPKHFRKDQLFFLSIEPEERRLFAVSGGDQ